MLLKWVITAAIVYFLYKAFFGSNLLPGPGRARDRRVEREREKEKEREMEADQGEYIDYEEVD
jgi:hypothetical protein